MPTDANSTLAAFNRWANAHIYDCCAMLTEDDYRDDRGAFFGSVHNTLNHLLLVDKMYSARIAGTPPLAITGLDDILYDDFDELHAARMAEDENLIALVEGLGDSDLRTVVSYKLSNGTPMETPRWLILTTLFNHQTHHRGQISCLLTQSGVAIPPLDIIFYAREAGLT